MPRHRGTGMNRKRKTTAVVAEDVEITTAEANRAAMPPPSPRSPPGKKAKVAEPPSPGKRSRRTLASYVKKAKMLMRQCDMHWVNARVEHAHVVAWFDGRMVRLQRELKQVAPERAWRVSDAIDRAVQRLTESYRIELEADLNQKHPEMIYWKAQYGLEAERNAMLRRRLRRRRMVTLHR